MAYPKCKVYNDGSHYIAIPHTTRPKSPKRYRPEEIIEVAENTLNDDKSEVKTPLTAQSDESEVVSKECSSEAKQTSKTRKMTRRQLFDELYAECKDLIKKERKTYILEKIRPYFLDEESAKQYVNAQFDRLQRNAIAKRTRLVRKLFTDY